MEELGLSETPGDVVMTDKEEVQADVATKESLYNEVQPSCALSRLMPAPTHTSSSSSLSPFCAPVEASTAPPRVLGDPGELHQG